MALFGKERESPEVSLHREGLDLEKNKVTMEASTYDDQYYMQHDEERQNLTKWQQDLTEDLDELRHDLKNEKKIDGNWKSNGLPPMVNERGISAILTYVKRFCNRNTMRCSMDLPTINKKMINFGCAIARELAVNYGTHHYDIDMTQYSSLNGAIRNMVHSTLLRALNDGERRSEKEIRRIIEAMNLNKPKEEEKKGLFKW